MAEEIPMRTCVAIKETITTSVIDFQNWLDSAMTCRSEIAGIWTNQIDGAGFNATSREAVKRWVDVETELFLQHQYPPERVYNMDESAFAIRASQTSRALVNIREASSWKQIGSRGK
ncbi:hypothetical protein H2203_005260 [Taxawa tesnikishii (nom. ined.)]|nr:hypothetical protein H2203_005260 [Dothideales sp. JES 119]